VTKDRTGRKRATAAVAHKQALIEAIDFLNEQPNSGSIRRSAIGACKSPNTSQFPRILRVSLLRILLPADKIGRSHLAVM